MNQQLEKIKLVMLHRPSLKFNSLEALSPTELDRMVAQVQLQAQQKETAQAQVKLELVKHHGLKNDPLNFANITRKLGQFYSVAQFRAAIDADQQFRNSLLWTKEPFAEVVREEQQTAASEERRRKQFGVVVGTLSTVNVSDCHANYFACEDQLPDLLVSHAITEGLYPEMLAEGLLQNLFTGLVKNDSKTTQDIDRQNREQFLNRLEQEHRLSGLHAGAVRRRVLTESTVPELRERSALVAEISDNYSPDRNLNANQFCVLFASVKSNEEYRQQLDLVREKKRLAQMSPSEIRAENERVRNCNNTIERHESDILPDGFRKLRPDSKWNGEFIDRGLLWRIPKEDVAKLIKIYGKPQLDNRIRTGIIPVAPQEN
jgi:hypothetical protein